MKDVYKKLAKHLDKLPAGFPATDSGVELKILKRLFSLEEAETAIMLTMFPESADAIAERIGRDPSEIESLLYKMSLKGLINRLGQEQYSYMAANFIVGVWEYNVNNLDESLIHDVDEYIPQIMGKRWARQKTQQLRVIPVSQSIPAEMNIMPYEEAETIIKRQSKIVVAPCICRKEQTMAGHGCDKPMENCLAFGAGAHFYEQNGIGRPITKDEALKILNNSIEAGLVLQPSNSQKPFVLCMCCGCCCLFLKNLNTMDEPAKIVNTNYYATVSEDDCTGCENCSDICQMDAIKIENESAVVSLARCIGCGLCVTRCEFEAVTLLKKPDTYVVPSNTAEAFMNMSRERGLI